jgi:MFS family permease
MPLLMSVSFLCYVNRVSIATAGDARIMEQYGLTPTRMGMVYSAFLLTYTCGMIPGGLFIDRVRPRTALLAVLVVSSIFVALTGLVGVAIHDGATAFAALLVVRGLMGIASAPLYPACAAAVQEWVVAGRRSRCNGLVMGSALVGVAVTPAAFGALIDRIDWPGTFLLAAVVTFALGVVWARYAPSIAVARRPDSGPVPLADAVGPRRGNPRQSVSVWRQFLGQRSLILLTLSYGCVGYFQYLFFYWMAYYFEKILVLPPTTSRGYAAVPPLAMALGMPLGGWLSDRLEQAFGRRRARQVVPTAGMFVGGLLLTIGVFAHEPVWIVTWFSLALGAVGAAEGPFWLTAVELGGRRGGRSAAVFNTGGNAGGLIAPVVTPWVGQLYGWPWAIGLGALVCFLGVALWLGIDPEHSPPETAAPSGQANRPLAME